MKQYIKEIENYPKPGISFKDIQPLLSDNKLFNDLIDSIIDQISIPDYFVGIESRGFILASALSMKTKAGLKLIRKAGKLPPPTFKQEYELEYGSDVIEMNPGEGTVVLVDDVYATGGTMKAAHILCEKAGYKVVDKIVALNLAFLNADNVKSVIEYE